MIPPIEYGFLRKGAYERAGIFAAEDVLADLGPFYKEWDGTPIWMNDARYRVFKRSLVCVRCQTTGTFFAKERSVRFNKATGEFEQCGGTWHLNLYGTRPYGAGYILMTKDHILPRSKGGSNADDNYQTMCTTCNARKGNRLVHTPLPKAELNRRAKEARHTG